MTVFAAVMTGKGTGAISTIQVFGDSAEDVIKKIFKPAGSKPAIFKAGKILLGTISNGDETIDQVTIGCEGERNYAINCHGNPLIVAGIMQLLRQHGANLITTEQLLSKILSAQESVNTIALEAKLTQPRARTIEGTKIIANQIEGGLSKTIAEWLRNINAIPLDQIRSGAERILKNTQTAKLIIAGCKAVIAGPPNTGKSTLLNCLCGRPKAIVTDIKGTTRDWVTARCQIDSLSIELIDTAGLDESRSSEGRDEKPSTASKNTLEKKSQQKTNEILQEADLVLLVLDNSQTTEQLAPFSAFGRRQGGGEKIAGKLVLSKAEGKILTVLNKSDLPAGFDVKKLPETLGNTVQISAKLGTGIENLLKKIRQLCGVAGFDLKTAVCITSRQEKLVKQLGSVKSKRDAVSIITELLNGPLSVG